jgi:hypothetical protein
MTDPDPLLLTVPRYRGRPAPLPGERRRAFVRFLRRLIQEALTDPPGRPSRAGRINPGPEMRQIAAAGCAACGGHCCSRGGTHAYLDHNSIRRVARAHPTLRAHGLAMLYVHRLPDAPLDGSCVFHRPDGCVLPRALRADLCNAFYCTPLVRFFRAHAEQPPAHVRIEAAATSSSTPEVNETR